MRVHLVDGTFELFRAHYSPGRSHDPSKGRDLRATKGVVRSLRALVKDKGEQVTHLAVAFDNPIRSFRNDLFSGYKSDEGVEPALREQFDDVEQAVAEAGFVVYRMSEFEADDAMATAAVRLAACPEVTQVRIMSPDKDLGQVLSGDRIVQVDRIRNKLMTEATLRQEKRIGPESVADYLALVGDSADGIPGIEGWGEKSTADVLSVYRHIEQIPADPARWEVKPRGAERLSKALEARRADALLYRTLATLRLDVPLDCSLSTLALRLSSS